MGALNAAPGQNPFAFELQGVLSHCSWVANIEPGQIYRPSAIIQQAAFESHTIFMIHLPRFFLFRGALGD